MLFPLSRRRRTAEMFRGVYPERTAEILVPQGGIRMTGEGLTITANRLSMTALRGGTYQFPDQDSLGPSPPAGHGAKGFKGWRARRDEAQAEVLEVDLARHSDRAK